VLRGAGDGSFEAMHPVQSGVVVPDYAQALVQLDLPGPEGAPGLFYTRHGSESGLLVPLAERGRWWDLRLEGTTGNPAGIGARLRLREASGREQVFEIGTGGGMGQAVPAIRPAEPLEGRLTEAVVRWPDGIVTRHAAPSSPGRWVLRREGEGSHAD
ncbi:MAG: hypothetical protein ACLFU2_02970, partial [Opitutales bacterium]